MGRSEETSPQQQEGEFFPSALQVLNRTKNSMDTELLNRTKPQSCIPRSQKPGNEIGNRRDKENP